ncbi:MAG: hypothetical protein JST47_07935 [Bacteroidetes bacterium]|nr:hypothetical protein [Bacteroidota bacterium]MBS1974673.1 hypothetical protein [Bacteroidota bacterium]
MKPNKSVIWTLIVLTVVAALYRIIPNRPWGFAPQWAMAIFAGAIIREKKWAFVIPVLSMFISDILYQVLYINGITPISGFYDGQWQNYLLFAVLAVFGMMMKKINVTNVVSASIAAPTAYFILSNLVLWAGWSGTRGLGRPKTFNGLLQCYNDALPFYRTSLIATVVFSAVLFGVYYFISKKQAAVTTA